MQVGKPLRCHLGGSPTCKMPQRKLPVYTVEHWNGTSKLPELSHQYPQILIVYTAMLYKMYYLITPINTTIYQQIG
jgi:hypothetical protein